MSHHSQSSSSSSSSASSWWCSRLYYHSTRIGVNGLRGLQQLFGLKDSYTKGQTQSTSTTTAQEHRSCYECLVVQLTSPSVPVKSYLHHWISDESKNQCSNSPMIRHLLILHGYAQNVSLHYRHFIQSMLANGIEVWALDLPNHGTTITEDQPLNSLPFHEKPETLQKLAQHAIELVTFKINSIEGETENLACIGFSLGSLIALQLLKKQDQLIQQQQHQLLSSDLFNDTSTSDSDVKSDSNQSLLRVKKWIFAGIVCLPFHQTAINSVYSLQTWTHKSPVWKFDNAEDFAVYEQDYTINRRVPPAFETTWTMHQHSVWAAEYLQKNSRRLTQSDCFFIHGTHDTICSWATVEHHFIQQLNNNRLKPQVFLVEGANHSLFFGIPNSSKDSVAKAVIQFLQK